VKNLNNLRVGLIGMGMMGRNHARVLSTLSGVEFVGISDPIQPDGVDRGFLGGRVFKETYDLLHQGLDYCVIAAPTGFHKEIALEAIDMGVNCLIEKPVALSYSDGLEIQEKANAKSLIVGVGHIERYNAAIRELKTKLDRGELGDIFQISLRRQGPFPARIADVGVIKDLATHDIDLATWISGQSFKSVSAQTAHRSGRDHEDLVSVNGLLTNDIVANILVNWLSPLKERNLIVIGEKGAFVVDTLNSDLIFYENGNHMVSQDAFLHFKGVSQGNVTQYAFEKPEPLLIEHQNFRDAILGKDSEIVTLEDGIETVRVADAVIRSSREKVNVTL
jgi:UDP-N-acetylglucosamine 3-dehydrogenase